MRKKLSQPQWNRSKGLAAELQVSEHFLELGYRLLAKNFYVRGGELDLILLSPEKTLVFVEVRSAASPSIFLTQSIRFKKLQSLRKTVFLFLRRYPSLAQFPRRFDVAWVRSGVVEHWKNVQLF